MPKIHPTAVVAESAALGADVEIGPYCVIGPDVSLGSGSRLVSHVSIQGHTQIGDGAKIQPFASLGSPPQSVHYKGEPARLVIGKNCDIRESVSINIGTAGGRMETRIGDNCMFMLGAHVAHDCIVGNNVIFANNATLGGHVEVGDFTFFGGLSAVHQNTRVGEQCMVAGLAAVRHDLIPFGMTNATGQLGGLNLIGLKRRGFSRETIHRLRHAYREIFYGEGSLAERVAAVERGNSDEVVAMVVTFIKDAGKRRILTPAVTGEDD